MICKKAFKKYQNYSLTKICQVNRPFPANSQGFFLKLNFMLNRAFC